MRTGCVCLTTTVLLNRAELVRLEGGTGGLPGAVVAAVGRVHPGKVLVSVASLRAWQWQACVLAVLAQSAACAAPAWTVPQHALLLSSSSSTTAVPRWQPPVRG